MKVTINDSAVLRAVLPTALTAYLRAHGWRIRQDISDSSVTYWVNHRESVSLAQPLDRDFDDYDARIYEIISELASLEARSQLEILKALQLVAFDVIRFCDIAGVDAAYNVPLEVGLRAVEGLYNLVVGAAYAAVERRKTVPTRRPRQVQEYLASTKFGPIMNGTVNYAVYSPLALAPYRQASLFPNEDRIESMPYERSVVDTIVNATRVAAQTADLVLAGESIEKFDDTVSYGVNATVCEALSDLAAVSAQRTPVVRIEWSPELPHPLGRDDAPTISVPPNAIEVLQDAARYFKETGEREDYLVLGSVVIMHREPQDLEGDVAIISTVNDRPARIHIHLEHRDYSAALKANLEKKVVAVVGTLTKKGRAWVLLSPRDFRILEDEISDDQ